jgi:hypothetical protein
MPNAPYYLRNARAQRTGYEVSSARRFVGVVLVLASAALFVVAWAALFVPFGTAGIRLEGRPNGVYVASVRDGAAATAASIRIGDRIYVRALSYSERLRLVAGAVSGTIIKMRVAHQNEPYRDVAVVAGRAQTALDGLAGRLPLGRTVLLLAQVAVSSIAFGVAALIGWRRPSLAAAASHRLGTGGGRSFSGRANGL